jgi:hypothetical protein
MTGRYEREEARREGNPVAGLLGRRRPVEGLDASPFLLLLPLSTWAVGGWAASHLGSAQVGGASPKLRIAALATYSALPALLLYLVAFDWRFHALVARMRSSGLFESLALSRLSFHETMLGVAIAAEREAARTRRDLATGLILPILASLFLPAPAGSTARLAAAILPSAALLAGIAWLLHRRTTASDGGLVGTRALPLSLPLIAARDAGSAFLATALAFVARVALVGPFLGMIELIATSGGAGAALAWWLLLGSIAFWTMFALWCWWLGRPRSSLVDDPFAAALRAHLAKKERRAKGGVAVG